MDEKVIPVVMKNKKVSVKLAAIVDMAGGKSTKPQGNLLYKLSAIMPPSGEHFTKDFVACIMADKWTKVM